MDPDQARAFREDATEQRFIFERQEDALRAGKGICHFFDLNQGTFFVPNDRKKILALIALAKRYRQGEDELLLNKHIRRSTLLDHHKPCKIWPRGTTHCVPLGEEHLFVSLKQRLKEQTKVRKI